MRKTVTSLVGAFALLLVIGAGCNATTTEPTQTGTQGPAETPADGTSGESTPVTGESTSGLTLSAETLGNMEVKLSWDTGMTLDESNRFVVVRGDKENPSFDGKHDWIRQYHKVRDVIWKQNKNGPMHFRVCITENNEKDTCGSVYSNDVMLEVK